MLNIYAPPVRIAAVLMLRFHVITQGWSRRVAGVRAWLHRLQLMRLSRRTGRGVRSPPLRWDGKNSDSRAAQRARRLLGQPLVEALLTKRVTASRDRGSLQRLQAQGAVSRRGTACWHGQRCACDFASSGFVVRALSRASPGRRVRTDPPNERTRSHPADDTRSITAGTSVSCAIVRYCNTASHMLSAGTPHTPQRTRGKSRVA